MEQWYYAKDGQQQGPIGLEELRGMIASGMLNPTSDLVWNANMTDWLPAAQIPVLTGAAPAPATGAPDLEPAQPFAYPTATGPIAEVIPGSEPIIATACVKRAWDLTLKNIGPLLAVMVIYIAISFAISLVAGFVGAAMGIPAASSPGASPYAPGIDPPPELFAFTIVSNVISSLVSVFLLLGATRIGLNVVSGKPFSVGMLFGQGRLVLRAFFAQILFAIVVGIGFILLIFPGVYLMLRYGQYMVAMVDKDMGIMDSFAYSSRITENNKGNIFVLVLFSILIALAGCLALILGLLFAYPMILIMFLVAYRWMQYGGRAVLDDPMTGQPLLANSPD